MTTHVANDVNVCTNDGLFSTGSLLQGVYSDTTSPNNSTAITVTQSQQSTSKAESTNNIATTNALANSDKSSPPTTPLRTPLTTTPPFSPGSNTAGPTSNHQSPSQVKEQVASIPTVISHINPTAPSEKNSTQPNKNEDHSSTVTLASNPTITNAAKDGSNNAIPNRSVTHLTRGIDPVLDTLQNSTDSTTTSVTLITTTAVPLNPNSTATTLEIHTTNTNAPRINKISSAAPVTQETSPATTYKNSITNSVTGKSLYGFIQQLIHS